jgi:hypothetical protein
VVAGIGTSPGEAAAQDFGAGGPQPTLTTSRIGLESSWAAFDTSQGLGASGDYYGLTARGDLKLSGNVGLRLLVPVYVIQLEGQQANAGFGDAELRVRFVVYEGHPWRFYAGLADQMPTGNTSLGLGQGGTQLSPFITGGWRKGKFVAFASVTDAIGVHPAFNKYNPGPSDYVDPSTDEELRTSVGGIVEATETLYFNAVVTAITPLLSGQTDEWLLVGGVAGGYLINDSLKVVVVGQAPLAGVHRFDEKIGLNLYLFF